MRADFRTASDWSEFTAQLKDKKHPLTKEIISFAKVFKRAESKAMKQINKEKKSAKNLEGAAASGSGGRRNSEASSAGVEEI